MLLNKRTKQMYAEGGMMQEGGTVDPISGNEVPVGSLQEEVRDDIPAKLSEGEFVVPADVVRYIGLEKLMKMRDAAKQGLERMEDVGQMGNADTAPAADEEFDDGFDTEIDDIIGEVDGELQMAEGGFVAGQDLSKAPKNPAVDVRYFKHRDGRMMFVTFINNRPMTAIPEGFTQTDRPEQQVGKDADERKKPPDSGGGGGGGDGGGGGNGADDNPLGAPNDFGINYSGTPVSADEDDPLYMAGNEAERLKTLGKLGRGAAIFLGGPLGLLLGPTITKYTEKAVKAAEGDFLNLVDTQTSPFGLGPMGDYKSVKSMTDQFGNNTAVMNGYFAAATDPFTSSVFNDLVANSGATGLTPAQVGVMGLAIGNSVNEKVANGMSLENAQQITRDEFDISGTSVSGGSVGEDWQRQPADMTGGVTAAPSAGSGYFSDNSEEMGANVTFGGPISSPNLVGTPIDDVTVGGPISSPDVVATPIGDSGGGGGGYDPGISGGYDSSPGSGYDSSIGGFFAKGGLVKRRKKKK
jgi:hypothetical protein